MFGIVFAQEKFDWCDYGHFDIFVLADHKPLEAIFDKDLIKNQRGYREC